MSSPAAHRLVHVGGLPVNVYTSGDISAIRGRVAVLILLHGRRGDAKELYWSVERAFSQVAQKKTEGKQERELVIVTFVSIESYIIVDGTQSTDTCRTRGTMVTDCNTSTRLVRGLRGMQIMRAYSVNGQPTTMSRTNDI